MPGVAQRNRVFGSTLKLRGLETTPARWHRERDRNISNAASTAGDSSRVVVMLISHLPNRTLVHNRRDTRYFEVSRV